MLDLYKYDYLLPTVLPVVRISWTDWSQSVEVLVSLQSSRRTKLSTTG